MQGKEDQMWLKPNVDAGDISSIGEYSLTGDGYGCAQASLGVALANRSRPNTGYCNDR